MFEKRKFPRLGESWDLDYKKIREKEFKMNSIDSLTVNISGGGICFEANEELPKGTMLALELRSTEFPSLSWHWQNLSGAKKKTLENLRWALNSGGPVGKTTTPKRKCWITSRNISKRKKLKPG